MSEKNQPASMICRFKDLAGDLACVHPLNFAGLRAPVKEEVGTAAALDAAFHGAFTIIIYPDGQQQAVQGHPVEVLRQLERSCKQWVGVRK